MITLTVSRLYQSPIAGFPGPKLAALTLWYEFYYDIAPHCGRYQWKIKETHEKYGPIIRITPFELHIDDLDFYSELYVGTSVRRTDKYKRSAHAFGGPLAAFGTVGHNVHRVRRSALDPFFSKKSVVELSAVIQSKIDLLLERLRAVRGTGEFVDLATAYSALTVDIITDYAFARSINNLDKPDFGRSWHKLTRDISKLYHFGKQFPTLLKLMFSLPESIAQAINPDRAVMPILANMMRDNIADVCTNSGIITADARRTIFHSLLFDSDLPPSELTVPRLIDEGISVVVAGSITVAHTLHRTTYEILSNPDVLTKLKSEFSTCTAENGGKPLKLSQLEQLPYLHAVINEGLRITYGVSHRLLRSSPDVPLHYKSWVIPSGVPVGMSSLLMHDNTGMLPSPRQFIPERWLGAEGKRKEKCIVTFSKGSRACVGMNLALGECHMILYGIPSGAVHNT